MNNRSYKSSVSLEWAQFIVLHFHFINIAQQYTLTMFMYKAYKYFTKSIINNTATLITFIKRSRKSQWDMNNVGW